MYDHGALPGARQRSNSESGHPNLSSTSIDDELVFNNADLSLNRNNLSHQSQQIISNELPEGYIESPMWVGTGTRLQESVCIKIANWQRVIDKDPITLEGIKNVYDQLKGAIYSLYQDALYARVTDKLSYDIISLIALIDCVKRAVN